MPKQRSREHQAFLALADGRSHYRIDGPPGAAVVLLLHGATVPAWEFDRIVPHLTGAGFRTLRLDLYGHGLSDRPRLEYGHGLFVRQVTQFLAKLGIDEPVHVLGHSLGAAIAARVACLQPHRFSRLILAAPLLDFTVHRPAVRVLHLPLLGEILMRLYVEPMLIRRRTQRYRDIEDGRFVGLFMEQLRKPGFGRALLSLIRSGGLADQRACYEALGATDHPVLVLRGVGDDIVTPDQIATIRTLVPRAGYVEIGGTAHAFLMTHPERVAPAVLDFLR